MTNDRIAEVLGGPHQAVLAVGRSGKGPIAVPVSYWFEQGGFLVVTSPGSVHGRAMLREGRATITVQFEACDGRTVHQWYVTAEGPMTFTDRDPVPVVRRILAKDRGPEHADAWLGEGPPAGSVAVAELRPDRIAGYEWRDSLPT